MDRAASPFPAGWYTGGPDVLWGRPHTCAFIPHELLPDLDRTSFDGDFEWLPPIPTKSSPLQYAKNVEGWGVSAIPGLVSEARLVGLELPPAFLRFISDADLYGRVPSPTACYLDFSHGLLDDPSCSGGRMLRFMNDSQASVLWYLYLRPQGDHCVVASAEWFDGLQNQSSSDLDPDLYFWCAEHFEQFVYRFWIENQIWHRVHAGLALTPEERRYLEAARRAATLG